MYLLIFPFLRVRPSPSASFLIVRMLIILNISFLLIHSIVSEGHMAFTHPSSRRNSNCCIQVCRQQGYYGGPPDKMKQKSRA
nr:MAG TPA_asm: hypothetical protein [Caudoviricetes sp.]